VVHAVYVTDPACPWSRGLDPGFRRQEREFGDRVEMRVVMGGLARETGPAEARVREWLDAPDHTGMPVDPRGCWEGPIASTFPARLAVLAAREQGLHAPIFGAPGSVSWPGGGALGRRVTLGSRAMVRVLTLAAVLAALVAPATTLAADPFGASPSDVTPTPDTQTVQTVQSSQSAAGQGLSGSAKTVLLVGAGLLLGGIAFVIVRDSRRSAPKRRHEAAAAGAGRAHPRPTPAPPGARGRPTGKASAQRKRAKRR
jgi:hypothetical protein